MYLKKLIITKDSGYIIRNIPFKMGLNLIVGLSNESGSSNSLGKTTLIRCINFCLAGKFEEFYHDLESKKIENLEVKNYLVENKVSFELVMGTNFNTDSHFDLNIKRKIVFNIEKNRIETIDSINNEVYSNAEFQEKLKAKLFHTSVNKPSFRNLITKFVRRNDVEVNNILKYLNVYTSDIEYTTLRFFLFGFSNPELIEKKQSIDKHLKLLAKQHKTLKTRIPEGTQQKIDLLQVELYEKEKLRDEFQIDEEYKINEDELAQVEAEINVVKGTLSNLDADKLTLISRIDQIRNNEFKDNLQNIKYLYDEAKLLNVDVHRKFEETISFHNSMLKNEERYLETRISSLMKDISIYEERWSNLSNKYNYILVKLGKQGALAEYTKLNEQITNITSDITKSSALLVELDELNTEIKEIKTQLQLITSEINESIDNFQKVNIHILNLYFSKYSEQLYNERWYISFDPDEGSYKFDVKAIESNAGSGKKQTLVAAFDIAYMAFIQDKKIKLPFPRFATQDKIEIIDIDELNKLAELVISANGQLIAPIIEDKFKNFDPEESKKYITLELSPDNKFFRIGQDDDKGPLLKDANDPKTMLEEIIY